MRVRIVSPGYKNDANCQFPRAIRQVGKKFSVKPQDVRLVRRGSSYFYSISTKNLQTIDDIPKQEIKNLIEKVWNTEDTELDCLICLDNPKDSVFNPCGHYVSCNNCAIKLKKCPMCRVEVISIISYEELR